MKKRKFDINALLHEAILRATVSLYSIQAVRSIAHAISGTRQPKKWVFILGCYNSGTTILRSLLSHHPEIRVLPREGVRLTKAMPRPEDLGWTRMWIGCPEHMTIPTEQGREIAATAIRDWSPWWGKGGSVYIEKSISNLTRFEWIAEHFPNAHFIGITRDGYAVSEGIRRKAIPKGVASEQFGEKYPSEWAARQWVECNHRLLQASVSVSPFHRLSYEELVTQPTQCLRLIFDFLELDQPRELSEVEGGVMINGNIVHMFDGNKISMQRLNPTEIDIITNEISEMQKKLGYETHQ